jgi:hypothetical protein
MDEIKKIKRSGGFRRRVLKYKNISSNYVQPSPSNGSATSESSLSLVPSTSSSETLVSLLPSTVDHEKGEDDAQNLENEIAEDSDDCTESESKADIDFNFREQLRNWSIDHNVPHTAINGLLQIINQRDPGVVPKDARTLLNTVKSVDTKPCGRGEYWHRGFEKNIVQYFQNLNKNMTLHVNVNIDGLPTFKSSKIEFWPILCNIHGMNDVPVMTVGIYCGIGKPECNEFLRHFVTEMKIILQDGIKINDYLITIKLRSFICDSPARAFIKSKQFP